ncbi:MAG: hypothetical protein COU07_02765 [Candidatus Harrisonbacteria bacterium CG10_big_fil_rev_8_21_14_0_10_40_38]|uniref:VIT family protein n=1 Tax=Candidatus Harrisonbacteria bacterium CG10_big_fil_rev_8_21_14_0_10_40_38 TaxID=1974583 RepID=A0A2H0URW3_9BACT|nr:MAG: hypothetical protein COU07_02765 [Candidatus Harrisonbacteria bacterium CG10_big_fil_rev_8_21_14_0_10_40_38]
MQSKYISASYLRNFIFGVEDSLVSTVGLLSGIAIAEVPRQTIVLTGIVLIFVEAFSMAVGSFLSEHSAEDFLRKSEGSTNSPRIGGVIMFFSYFIAGFIPLSPYFFFETKFAFGMSIAFSLISLFLLGFVSARFSHSNIWRSGFRMLLLGGVAIFVGTIVGQLVNNF